MSDPLYRNAPGTNPPRHIRPRYNYTMEWTLGAVAAALLLGLVVWGMSGDNRSASNPAPTTTGQSSREPAGPIPTNPNATTPQPDPAQPAPR